MLLTLLALVAQDENAVRAAVRKAIPLLEKSSAKYVDAKTCFSCHHQAVPLFALLAAKAKSFDVDEKNLKAQAKFTWDSLNGAQKNYSEGKGQGGAIATASYALWTLDLAQWSPDDTTGAVAGYVAGFEKDKDWWKPPSHRPPQVSSPITTTALSIRSLQAFGTTEQKGRLERARAWLLQTKAKDTEERVFRLRGLVYSSAGKEAIDAAAAELVAAQRDDGGWAQLGTMESDAYATGSALAALRDSGTMKTSDEKYRRGVALLLGTQKEDGSWHVATRSKPVQKYFESGFPHGKDQFISISATAWSVAALAFACEKADR